MAQLLHMAGPDVQDIFYTLSDTGTAKEYKRAVDALNGYFIQEVNPAFARHTFRQMTQETDESVEQFVTRLRQAVEGCDYGADGDNEIRDQLLCSCKSDYLRRKLLEEGKELTLKKTLTVAEQCEGVELPMSNM